MKTEEIRNAWQRLNDGETFVGYKNGFGLGRREGVENSFDRIYYLAVLDCAHFEGNIYLTGRTFYEIEASIEALRSTVLSTATIKSDAEA